MWLVHVTKFRLPGIFYIYVSLSGSIILTARRYYLAGGLGIPGYLDAKYVCFADQRFRVNLQ